MHEWALLAWYDKAVFALAHGRCCERRPTLAAKPVSGPCAFDAALAGMVEAARGTDTAALELGRKRYDESATCLLRSGFASAFGHATMPSSGSFTVFLRIAERARQPRADEAP